MPLPTESPEQPEIGLRLMAEGLQVQLLSDHPADTDAFGSHQRLADAVLELIRNEAGGKAIALTGSWGSGKSTVIKLIEQGLSVDNDSNDKEALFLFDAWSHEGDPLRRAFLEQLIDFLSDIDWLKNKSGWAKIKQEIQKRLKVSQTTQAPVLQRAGIWFAFSLLLVPIGLALFSTVSWPSAGLSVLILSFLLVLSPAIVILVLLGLLHIDWLPDEPDVSTNSRSTIEREKRHILALLTSSSHTTTRDETYETPDPTSIEFQGYFSDLLKEALAKEQKRRLVIVVDNLDRVDSQDALSIWSTMRTFFEIDNKKGSWSDHLWMIVPFDPEGLQSLWNDPRMATEDTSSSQQAAGETSAVERFVKKTFQITFRVPPQVPSD